MLIYNGQIIAGGGTIVLPMTRAEYEANKTILDSADVWVDLTDEPDQVAEADQIAYSVDGVQKGMGYIGDIATKAIAKVEPSDTALYAHAVGEYFINKDGELCRTTSAIQVGQTITVGTNCVITSVGGEIKQINSNLTAKTVVPQNFINGQTVANVTVKEASLNGHGYLVFFPQFTEATTIILDARYVYISENGSTIYSSWFVHNSTNNLTNITKSGNTITFTFANPIYGVPCYLKIM